MWELIPPAWLPDLNTFQVNDDLTTKKAGMDNRPSLLVVPFGSGCHFTADLRATATSFGALPAMLHPHCSMFFTLLCTAVANLRTKLAKLVSHLALEAHHLRSSITDTGTFQIQFDTGNQVFYIRFLQAGNSTIITHDGALLAGFYAFLVLTMLHGNLIW